MLLDIAAASAYGRFNKKFATIVGLETSVYWSEIMVILERVREKKTYDAEGWFKLNREYVQKQTTLTSEQQIACDATLAKLGLLETDSVDLNKMRVDIRKFFYIITEEDLSEIKKITKTAKSTTKAGKAEGKKLGIINRLFSRVLETDQDLLQLYMKFIEVAYSKGMQTNAQIDLFQQELNAYTEDLQVKKDILKIAIERGYKCFEWSKTIYEKDHKGSGAHLAVQKVGTTVSTDIEF